MTRIPRCLAVVGVALSALGVTLTAATILFTAPALAGPVVDPAPIRPNQTFIGEVNSQSANAVIRMDCFGPTSQGQLGHPLDGQFVEALPVINPTSKDLGYTGSAARQVNVTFGGSADAAALVVLTSWAVPGKIPTTLQLPCSGTGTVTFAPALTSPTARSTTVDVTFVGQP